MAGNSRYLGDGGGLYFPGVSDVWSSTQINQGTTTIYGGGGCGYLLVKYTQLELVILQLNIMS